MCDTLKFLAQLSPTLIRKLASVPLYIASLKPSAMTPLFASAQSIKGALSCTGFPKQQQKHSSTLIFLTLHVYSICGNKPHQGFWTSGTRFIAHLFLPFAAPPPLLSCGLCASSYCLLWESPSLEILRELYVLQRSPTEQILVVVIMQIQGWNCISRSGSVQICTNRNGALAVYSNA